MYFFVYIFILYIHILYTHHYAHIRIGKNSSGTFGVHAVASVRFPHVLSARSRVADFVVQDFDMRSPMQCSGDVTFLNPKSAIVKTPYQGGVCILYIYICMYIYIYKNVY